MPSIFSALKSNFPEFNFRVGDQYYWSPSTQAIYYSPLEDGSINFPILLHELSHALLGHSEYKKDIDLIKMERDAWEKAFEIAPKYGISISPDLIEESMNSYRDWMYERSLCPTCGAVGIEVSGKSYKCIACSGPQWRPNEARTCGLRRYKI